MCEFVSVLNPGSFTVAPIFIYRLYICFWFSVIFLFFFLTKVGLKSSGPIAVLSLAFVTGLGWRRGDTWVRKKSCFLCIIHMYSLLTRWSIEEEMDEEYMIIYVISDVVLTLLIKEEQVGKE